MGCNRIEVSLGDLGEIVGGATPSTRKLEYWDGGIPWISPKDLTNHGSRFIEKGSRNITEEGLNSCSARLLPRGSVLFSSRAPIGYCAISSTPMCTNQGFKSIVPKGGVDPQFIYYLLCHYREAISRFGIGTTFPEVSGKVMRRFRVEIPESESEMSAIASFLGCIDDKIELNNQINDYLSRLRNTITKRISNAFECEAENWQSVPLKNVAQIQSGYSYKSAELVEESSVGMLGIKNFNKDGSFRIDGIKPLKPEKAKLSQYVVPGEIVVAHTDLTQDADIIGRAIQVIDTGGYRELVASLDLVKVTSTSDNISNEFLAALLSTDDFHNHCHGYINGTTVLHLSKKALPEYQLKIPKNTTAILELDPIFKRIAQQQASFIRENCNLKQLRGTLLPKLMSGELDVSKVNLTQLNNHLSDC